MRVFVTGATGFVGSAVVGALVSAGHEVVGLVRSDVAERALEETGAVALRGSVEDDGSLRAGVERTDAVIHTAFNPRAATEEAFDSIVARGVRAAVVRLPPTVHGQGDPHFVTSLVALARAKGKSAFLGEGANRWPAVHRFDAALVYRLVLERGFEPGARFHAVAEEGVPLRDIAAAIGRGLGVPVGSERPEHFGGMAHFAALDLHASSTRTREALGWEATGPGLLADLELSYLGK